VTPPGSRRASLQQKVAFLRNPGHYPEGGRTVRAIETHFAWVFLTARHAYKLKKPLRHASLDNRRLAARERCCREELRLNRRLAPRVYLRVVPLTSRNGTLAIGGAGRVEDWLVQMRRLPSARMLDRILRRRTLHGTELDRLCARLARFFARAEPRPFAARAYLARLRRQLGECHRVLRSAGARISQSRVEALANAQRRFIVGAPQLLAARGACVVEGHGDLRAEHVCLGPPVCVIDCLEFSRGLRLLDPTEEVALLALDIERLGHARLAAALLARVPAARDHAAPESVVNFYMSQRAAIRAMLAVWHLGDPQFPDARPWISRAHSDLAAAYRHACRALALQQPPLRRVRRRPAFQ
jgi:aminoglycoside phosphotransferase family enzyme